MSVMRFWVSVPVLSEQMTEAEPSVSTAGRRRIMALCLTICCTPMDSTTVTIAGRPSGIALTASETAVMNISIIGMPSMSPITNITAQVMSATMPSTLPRLASFCCRGVSPSSCWASIPAILPIWVFMPVCVTTARARP